MNKFILIALFLCMYFAIPCYAFNRCINEKGKEFITDRPCVESVFSNQNKEIKNKSTNRYSVPVSQYLNKQDETSKAKQYKSIMNKKDSSSYSMKYFNERERQVIDVLKTLLLSFQSQNKQLFQNHLLPSQAEYSELRHRGSGDYEIALKYYLDKWESIASTGRQLNIKWLDVEYLGYSGMTDPKYAKLTLNFRGDHENYVIPVQLSQLHGRWLVMQLDGLKKKSEFYKKPTFKALALGERYSFSRDIPKAGYKAVYFNIKTGQTGCSEDVDEINVDLGDIRHKQFVQHGLYCGIPVKQLGAYFVGYVQFNKDSKKILRPYYTHWAKVQIDIDGKPVIAQGAGDTEYNFTNGRHKIEALYQPNLNPLTWAAFAFWMADPSASYSRNEVKFALPDLQNNETQLWYAAIYKNKDSIFKPVRIELRSSAKPVVLLLKSNKLHQFIIDNAEGAKLKAIIFSGDFACDFTVTGTNTVPVYHIIGSHSFPLVLSLNIHNDQIYETKSNLENFFNSIELLSHGGYISGFSSRYNADSLDVPEKYLSRDEYQLLQKQLLP